MNKLSWREPSLNLIIEATNNTVTYIPLSINGRGESRPRDKLPISSYLNIQPLKILEIDNIIFIIAKITTVILALLPITDEIKINGNTTGPLIE
jgi:hypothetical protein